MIRDFEYFSPTTLKEALALMERYSDTHKVICGGQSLLILMRQGLVAPEHLISIKCIAELNYINADAKKGLRIGALTTHRTIEKSAAIQKAYPALAEMEKRVASIQTRNWGTIGGNLCHGDPAGDPAPVLMALGATLTKAGAGGTTTMPIEEFFLDYFETALQPGELLTEIQVPVPAPNTGTAYTKFNIIQSDMATVGVAVSITLAAGGVCGDVRIALGAAAPIPMRAKKAEELLRGNKITEGMLKAAGDIAATEADPISDIHASEEYRRELVRVLVKRVGLEALARARA